MNFNIYKNIKNNLLCTGANIKIYIKSNESIKNIKDDRFTTIPMICNYPFLIPNKIYNGNIICISNNNESEKEELLKYFPSNEYIGYSDFCEFRKKNNYKFNNYTVKINNIYYSFNQNDDTVKLSVMKYNICDNIDNAHNDAHDDAHDDAHNDAHNDVHNDAQDDSHNDAHNDAQDDAHNNAHSDPYEQYANSN